jgi:hypothetical protein
MYALIETKNATHIAIHIPAERANESLPAIARMLETNAVFIKQSWREMETVKASMTIVLGDTYDIDNNEGEVLKVISSNDVIGDEFIAESPDVYRSNKAYREKKEAEITAQKREIDSLKLQVEKLQASLAAALNPESVEEPI